MTDKQKRFVDAYLGPCRFNATAAARAAGYAGDENALGVAGHDNLRNPKIQAAIKERVNEYAMSAEEVLSRLSDQARGNMADFVEAEHWGGRPVIVFNEDTLKGKGHLIKRFKSGKTGTEIELYDAQAALVQLGKSHKLWVDKQETQLQGELTIKVEYEDADSNSAGDNA